MKATADEAVKYICSPFAETTMADAKTAQPVEPRSDDQPSSPASIWNVSGGTVINTFRDVYVGGDVIGRDKIVNQSNDGNEE